MFTHTSQLKWAPEEDPKGKNFEPRCKQLLTKPLSKSSEHGVSLV